MKTWKQNILGIMLWMMIFGAAMAQNDQKPLNEEDVMKTYLIERTLPGAGDLSQDDLKNISAASNGVIEELGKENIEWIHSYVTGEKIVCLYRAKNEELIKKHAKLGGFPCDTIRQVGSKISPATPNQ